MSKEWIEKWKRRGASFRKADAEQGEELKREIRIVLDRALATSVLPRISDMVDAIVAGRKEA